jgi:hypothetical protein
MRPTPSLHYVSTLLDRRRRRYHRARRLWSTGLTLLGLGLLLVGWWGTLRLSPSSTPQAAAVSPTGLPALPSGATGRRLGAVEPRWGGPGLREPGVCQDCARQTLSPWRPACTPGDVVAPECPTLPWGTTEPSQRPWELALPERGPVPVQTGGALADATPPRLPARGDHPLAPLASPACEAARCPAVHAAGRPASSHAQQPQRRRPQGLRSAGPRRPVQPVPPQRRASDYALPFLAEPERLTASP